MKTTILSLFAAALLAASPGIAVASDAGSGYTIFGYGLQSCAEFLEEYREDSGSYAEARMWIAGYMTAAGRWQETQKRFGGDNVDVNDIVYLIRAYCKENPFNDLSRAAENVTHQLLDKAGRR